MGIFVAVVMGYTQIYGKIGILSLSLLVLTGWSKNYNAQGDVMCELAEHIKWMA